MKITTNSTYKNKFFLVFLSLMIITPSLVSGADYEVNKKEIFDVFNPAIVRIEISDDSNLDVIIDHDLSFLDIKDEHALAFATSEDLIWLKENNYEFEIVYENYAEMMGWDKNPSLLDDFHKYNELTVELEDIASSYPDIADLYDLGTSVQGRKIWGLKITDNPDVEEDEPEIRICGCHHGNEIMSVELPLLLAWYMVENYESDARIKDLVENRETWIIPMVNPDGREISTRVNANGVDLNRDYGYLWDGSGSSPSPFSQPETKVIREHALDNNFVLSLSYHTTAKYINYVWNYKGEPVEDNDVVVYLSNKYGEYNDYVVVEGFDWYQTRGDTNDFSYGCRGDIDWTIETENSNIPYVWNKNMGGMLDLIELADMGLRGIVTDAETGFPVPATIWVEEIYWPCFTDPKVGDYHKPLLPGMYNIIFRANGYEEQIHQVTVSDSEPTVLDVEMVRGGGNYAEQVSLVNFYDPYSYPNSFQNNPTEAVSALGPPDDIFASLGVGGSIVLDMGEIGKIYDSEGDDFTVYEGDETSDGYTLYVSDFWDGPWTNFGTASGTTSFDLGEEDIDSARFIKIIDDGSGSATETNPGFDLDAIQNLNPTDVFVDDDFSASTPGWGYDHFDNIDDAIDVTAGMGSIIIYEGNYSAVSAQFDIIIDKPIALIGEGETKPFIDGLGEGNTLTIISDRATVCNLTIKNSGEESNDAGIDINSGFNLISNLNIIDNRNGLRLGNLADKNKIYHNNFFDNFQNALDIGKLNQWDDGYPSGGNYWDDYTGTDSNSDGIGDTSYFIPGGSGEDQFPLMKPYGYINNPPNLPVINGPTEGRPNIEYDFTIVSTDEDNDDLYYTIDWGDGNFDETEVFPSGNAVIVSHKWQEKETYIIRVKAHDPYGDESDWGTFEVIIPRDRHIHKFLFNNLFRLYQFFRTIGQNFLK